MRPEISIYGAEAKLNTTITTPLPKVIDIEQATITTPLLKAPFSQPFAIQKFTSKDEDGGHADHKCASTDLESGGSPKETQRHLGIAAQHLHHVITAVDGGELRATTCRQSPPVGTL